MSAAAASSSEPRTSSRTRTKPERLVDTAAPEKKKKIRRAGKKAPTATPKVAKGKAAAGKKASSKKDANKPKRARSAYLFFSQEVRDAIKKANPELGFADVTRQAAAKWNKLSSAQKNKFEQMAAKDKIRAQKEQAEYEKKNPK